MEFYSTTKESPACQGKSNHVSLILFEGHLYLCSCQYVFMCMCRRLFVFAVFPAFPPWLAEKLTLFILKVHDTDLPSCLPSFTLILTNYWNLLSNIGMNLTEILKSLILLPLHYIHTCFSEHTAPGYGLAVTSHILLSLISGLSSLNQAKSEREREMKEEMWRERWSPFISGWTSG